MVAVALIERELDLAGVVEDEPLLWAVGQRKLGVEVGQRHRPAGQVEHGDFVADPGEIDLAGWVADVVAARARGDGVGAGAEDQAAELGEQCANGFQQSVHGQSQPAQWTARIRRLR